MEDKKEVKISLGTAIYIFIIIVLLIALGCMYYFGIYKNNQNKQVISETKKEQIKDSNNSQILSNSEIQTILGPEDAYFCIENIEKEGNKYTITAYMLEKEPRVITKAEYENLLNGGEIEFRNLKWEKDNNSQYQITNGIIIKSGDSKLAVGEDFGEWAIYNIAGIKENLNDYSEQKIEFKVSQSILIGGFFSDFRFGEDGNIKTYDIDGKEINNFSSFSFQELLNFSEGCRGSYEECKAYVKNGEVKAIKIFEK